MSFVIQDTEGLRKLFQQVPIPGSVEGTFRAPGADLRSAWLSEGAGPRLLATERECEAGNDEGQEKDRQDALSGASEGDGLAVGGVEGLGSA